MMSVIQKILTVSALLLFSLQGASGLYADEQVPAFPGAEGFGRYASGGRGGQVYHVTTLEDNGTVGSFRHACMQKGPRVIVFDVCGTIFLRLPLVIKDDDITIAGQTAPGDGICIANYPFNIRANNVIIRYMRFRCGDRYAGQHDGFAVSSIDYDNIILDHCSISWALDDCCSIYAGSHLTVQWCIISQGLVHRVNDKSSHGYGGNCGGSGSTFAHNLMLHHSSRSPRLTPRYLTQEDERVDMRNNVFYNWGGNGCYGAEAMKVNVVNNYYKPGPGTGKAIGLRILAPFVRTTEICEITAWDEKGRPKDGNQWAPTWHKWGKYYVVGNVNPKYLNVTDDNWTLGVANQVDRKGNDGMVTDALLDSIHSAAPLAFPYTTTWSAVDAYVRVLSYAGCCKERANGRLTWDRIDSVMISDTRRCEATYTGREPGSGKEYRPGFVASQEDCGGWPELQATDEEVERASVDSDADGIPDFYENLLFGKKGAEPNELCTRKGYTQYTNMDYYLAMLCHSKVTRFISPECSEKDECTKSQPLGDETGHYVWREKESEK